MDPEILVWLFPIIFMIHEFEEMIFMPAWLKKNRSFAMNKFPVMGKRFITQQESISGAAFTLIVAEEFVLASIIVIISALTKNFNLYLGLVIAYSIHLLGHIGQTIALRRYTPAIVTSLLTGIFCVYVIYQFVVLDLLIYSLLLIYSIVLTLIVFANLKLMHHLASRIRFLKNIA